MGALVKGIVTNVADLEARDGQEKPMKSLSIEGVGILVGSDDPVFSRLPEKGRMVIALTKEVWPKKGGRPLLFLQDVEVLPLTAAMSL